VKTNLNFQFPNKNILGREGLTNPGVVPHAGKTSPEASPDMEIEGTKERRDILEGSTISNWTLTGQPNVLSSKF
jgi:hypothetical protein